MHTIIQKILSISLFGFLYLILFSFFYFHSFNLITFFFSVTLGCGVYLFLSRKKNIFFNSNLNLSSVLIFGCALRALWVSLNYDFVYTSDWLKYHELAVEILNGNFLFNDFKPSGISILTALFYFLFGVNHFSAVVVQIIISVSIIYLVYKITSFCFNKKTGLIAAVLTSLSPDFIVYCNVVNSQLLFTFLFLTAVLVLTKKISLSKIFFISILIGFSQYVRPTGNLLLFSFIAFIFLTQSLKKRMKYNLIFITLFLFTQIPIFYYNYQNFELVSNSPATGQSLGWSMLIGWNINSKGVYNNKDLEALYDRVYKADKKLMPYQIDSIAKNMAIERIKKDPLKIMAFSIFQKPLILWSMGPDVVGLNNKINDHKIWIVRVSILFHKLFLILFVFGLYSFIKEKKKSPIILYLIIFALAFTALHTFLNVGPRYIMPLKPLLIILSAYYISYTSSSKSTA